MPVRLSCPACADAVPRGSRFCPHCGTPLRTPETAATRVAPPVAEIADARPSDLSSAARTTMHAAERRPLGVAPATLLATTSAVVLAIALGLFVLGVWIAGLVALLAAAAVAALFVSAARYRPEAPAARVTNQATARAGAATRLTLVGIGARARAAIDLLRLRQRRLVLSRELQHRLVPLGEAVYRDDGERAEALKAQAAEIEAALRAAEREAATVRARAAEKIDRERATAQPTEALPVDRISALREE